MKTLDGTEQRKLGLPTYCYCNYRLLRAMNLASASELMRTMGQDLNPYWFKEIGNSKEDLVEMDIPLEGISVKKRTDDGRWWRNVGRSVKLDLNRFQKIPNYIRRVLYSDKEYGNPMDVLLCFWFSKNAAYLDFIDKGEVLELNLSDPRSPGIYKIEFSVSGKRFRILIVGVRSPKIRRGKKIGKVVENNLAVEQAQTAAARTIESAMDTVKRVQSSQQSISDESYYDRL